MIIFFKLLRRHYIALVLSPALHSNHMNYYYYYYYIYAYAYARQRIGTKLFSTAALLYLPTNLPTCTRSHYCYMIIIVIIMYFHPSLEI